MNNDEKAKSLAEDLYRVAHVTQPPAEAKHQMEFKVKQALDEASRERTAPSSFVLNQPPPGRRGG